MQINLHSIGKQNSSHYGEYYLKLAKNYTKINEFYIFNNTIKKAQSTGEAQAKEAYYNAFYPKLKRPSLNIVLDEQGKTLNSLEFSKLIQNQPKINFFIGGAYGFNTSFINSCDNSISLSKLTYSKDLAYIVLCEQIYRALSIINNHPYHKI
jgi:23S rRNA (pseudouridine1915-N3)-methyltransferase